MDKMKSLFLAILLATAWVGFANSVAAKNPRLAGDVRTGAIKNPEGPICAVEIEAGPFDLHRRYKSMEGPYVVEKLRIADLISQQKVVAPESAVAYVEGSGLPNGMVSSPSMISSSQSTASKPSLTSNVQTGKQLYWWKGIKLEVLDENNKVMPTAEFICHHNVDIDPTFRNQAFPESERCVNSRLISLTQGQTEFYFPSGYAIPVANDETWSFTFQAANRTTDEHRRLKHRLTVYFIKDKDLVYPIKALNWYVPYITVVTDNNTESAASKEHSDHPNCLASSAGVNAPNDGPHSLLSDSIGRRLSGHWVVPPGTHEYSSPIQEERDPGFSSKNREIHAVWTHIHPLCTKTSLVNCDNGNKQKLFTVHTQTKTSGGLEIKSIEPIYSEQGIVMPAGKNYELTSIYENKTGEAQDSMVALGIFFADHKFARPNWAENSNSPKNLAFCGVDSKQCASGQSSATGQTSTSSKSNAVPSYPSFQVSADGPLLTQAKYIELETSAGKIHLELDPSLARVHATQMYKLFKSGAFNGTSLIHFVPGSYMQIDSVENKIAGQAALPAEAKALLRRLPLEVESQFIGLTKHDRYVLSMSRWDDPDSAVSSFCIFLAAAPQLDKHYTVFGRVIPDTTTLATLDQIAKAWTNSHSWILGSKEIQAPVSDKSASAL